MAKIKLPTARTSQQLLTVFGVVSLLCLLLISLPACSRDNSKSSTPASILNVAVLFGSGGLGDRSFNDSAYQGLLEAQKVHNIRFETVDSVNKEANIDALRFYAQNQYDLIIAIGFEHLETVRIVSKEFPLGNFGAIDFELNEPNVASIVYREQEGDFLMGVLAAMLTKTGKIGVIGGADIPAIRRILSGFKQGAVYQDSKVQVFTDIAGTFSDPQVGLTLALTRYNQGVDVIHNAASRTGLGIIEAAKQTGSLTTGTSGDQRYLGPGNVVGNRPKRVDTALLLLVEEVQKGAFTPGIRSLGLKENGISLGPFDATLVTQAVLQRLEDLKAKIVGGQIVIQAE